MAWMILRFLWESRPCPEGLSFGNREEIYSLMASFGIGFCAWIIAAGGGKAAGASGKVEGDYCKGLECHRAGLDGTLGRNSSLGGAVAVLDPWECPRPGWMGFGAAWDGGRCWAWNWMGFKAHPNPNHSRIPVKNPRKGFIFSKDLN